MVGTVKKSIETSCWAWFAQFENSPWMRGAPQPGFSRHILRIRSRTSLEMTGRPGFPQRTFQVQNKRKPARCQGYDRFWLDDDQRRAPIAPEARQTDPQ